MNITLHLKHHWRLLVASICIAVISICTMFVINAVCSANDKVVLSVGLPKNYTESESNYNQFNFNSEDWSTYVPPMDDVFTSVTLSGTGEIFSPPESFVAQTPSMSQSDSQLIMLSESEAWELISSGLFSEYPNTAYKNIKSQVAQIHRNSMSMITVKCWYWANPSDDTDMSKVTVMKQFAVNSAVAELFTHAFEDIYNDPSKPVINIADAGMGTWVLRGKNHSDNNTVSSHALGCAIDINPSTGSFYVNGTWYGNAYKQKSMPYSVWYQLPECHKKYHVLYQDCSIVSIFKSYGFYWGGDWKSGTDPMHIAFIGDGSSARETGQSNYRRYN